MLNKIKRIAKNRVVWDKDSTQRSVAGDFYDTVCDALEDALEIIAKLERVARAAKLYLEHSEPELADELEEALKELEKN